MKLKSLVPHPLAGHLLLAAVLIIGLVPSLGWACACGCGVFDVGTSAMFPTGQGGMAFLEYDFMDQDKNWSGTSSAPAANNADKTIRTHFLTAGIQYMFNREWGIRVELPYWDRYFKTTDDAGNIVAFDHGAMGDMRIRGVYSGFSPDMSTGITFGLKLPTGDYTYSNFDRDTQIGTGSTDVLLGAYHIGAITADHTWDWFTNVQLDQPVLIRGDYCPGSEINAVAGIYYDGWQLGKAKIAPLVQVIGSHRWRDTGSAANFGDSGYSRILASPGIEVDVGSVKVYADVALPAYQDVNGNQLVASALFKVNISYSFSL